MALGRSLGSVLGWLLVRMSSEKPGGRERKEGKWAARRARWASRGVRLGADSATTALMRPLKAGTVRCTLLIWYSSASPSCFRGHLGMSRGGWSQGREERGELHRQSHGAGCSLQAGKRKEQKTALEK